MADWSSMEPLSLVRYGLEPSDDEALRRYFSLPQEPPATSGFLAQWCLVDRVFGWEQRELKDALDSFYASGLLPYAFASKFMAEEHEALYPVEARPLGGAALVAWEARQQARPALLVWVRSVYLRVLRMEASGRERLLLEQVESEASVKLERLVHGYQRRRDHLAREDAKAAAREGTTARPDDGVKKHPASAQRRRERNEPEVFTRRPRPR